LKNTDPLLDASNEVNLDVKAKKIPLGSYRRRWKDNSKMYVKETDWESVD
jgi:hypothetical protein